MTNNVVFAYNKATNTIYDVKDKSVDVLLARIMEASKRQTDNNNTFIYAMSLSLKVFVRI